MSLSFLSFINKLKLDNIIQINKCHNFTYPLFLVKIKDNMDVSHYHYSGAFN